MFENDIIEAYALLDIERKIVGVKLIKNKQVNVSKSNGAT